MKRANRAKKMMTASATPALAPDERPLEDDEAAAFDEDVAEAAAAVTLGSEDVEPDRVEDSLSLLSLSEEDVEVVGLAVLVRVPVAAVPEADAGRAAVVDWAYRVGEPPVLVIINWPLSTMLSESDASIKVI